MSPEQRQLFKRVDEVLHYLWDPIGMSDVPAARDEYSTYVPGVLGLLLQGADESSIAEHLLAIERKMMGLPGSVARSKEVAEVLLGYRDHLLR